MPKVPKKSKKKPFCLSKRKKQCPAEAQDHTQFNHSHKRKIRGKDQRKIQNKAGAGKKEQKKRAEKSQKKGVLV